jgi:hypothetical protein
MRQQRKRKAQTPETSVAEEKPKQPIVPSRFLSLKRKAKSPELPAAEQPAEKVLPKVSPKVLQKTTVAKPVGVPRMSADYDFQQQQAFINVDGKQQTAIGKLLQVSPKKGLGSEVAGMFEVNGAPTQITVQGIWWEVVQTAPRKDPSSSPVMFRLFGERKRAKEMRITKHSE